MKAHSLKQLKQAYSENRNILAMLRDGGSSQWNSPEAILISYDLQTGSYVKAMEDPAYREKHLAYSREIAGLVSECRPATVLEAGTGEATTLCSILTHMDPQPTVAAGFDISWSRVDRARRYAGEKGFPTLLLSTGDMMAIPFPDNSFDVVFTAHAVEPNRGREHEIIVELCRVARHRVILCEPSYELGNDATRKRIEDHGYCRGLRGVAEQAGVKVLHQALLRNPMRADNATAALVLEVPAPAETHPPKFGCPSCHEILIPLKSHLFCESCCTVQPVVSEVPCLLRSNSILATHFADAP